MKIHLSLPSCSVLCAAALLACIGVVETRGTDVKKTRDIEEIVRGFDVRRVAALESIIATDVPPELGGRFLSNQVKALAMLNLAERTRDHSRVAEANELLMDFCRMLDRPQWWGRTNHAGALLAMRTLLTYEKRPDLLFPTTVAKLRDGVEPDGRKVPEQSLRAYLPQTTFTRYIRIGIHTWPKPFEGTAGYTENHRLQYTVHALLLCQIYGGETFDPVDGPPVRIRSKDAAEQNYYDYWKGAFYEYLVGYRKPRMTIEPWQVEEFRHMDWGITEKDGPTYTHVFLGDFWILRDLTDDPVIAKYCEMFIDLILADYAEEAVRGVFAGAHENAEKHTMRLPGLLHVFNHLLFDDLPFTPPAKDYLGWGAWGYLSLLTSDYNPTHPDFPKAIIDLAVNKPAEGYMVTEAVTQTPDGRPDKPKATWIKPDYALGFSTNSWNGWGYHTGGAYVATKGRNLEEVGLALIPFGQSDNNHFDLKYSLICPMISVVGPDAAITQNGVSQLPSKLWIKDGFEEDFISHPPWMFFAADSVHSRKVFIAVRPVLAGHRLDTPRTPGKVIYSFLGERGEPMPELAHSTVADHGLGKIIAMENPADFLVWEMSDSDRHASFDDFKRAVAARRPEATEEYVTFVSSGGTKLEFHRDEARRHRINGETVSLDAFRHVVKNPWMEWPQNAKRAEIARGPYRAQYDFDPDRDGVFEDRMPEKRVQNAAGVRPR